MTVLIVIQTLLVLGLAVLVVGLLRSHAEILRRLHELGVNLEQDQPAIRTVAGVPEPRPGSSTGHDLVGSTPQGGAISVRTVGVEHTTLLAFLSSGCLTCKSFWDDFRVGQPADLPGEAARLVIVTKGAGEESESKVRELAPTDVTTVMSTAAWEDYGIPVSPYFLLVHGPSGVVIGEGAAASWSQVSSLLQQALADAAVARRRRPRNRSGRERHADTDAALLAAGITPGHPSLYPDRPPDELE